jgi:hypothetical protein
MATLLPPPKRQKLNFDPSKVVEAPPPADVPHVVVQFKNAEDGSFLGPAINLPANTSRDAMQMLVNKLRGEVGSMAFLLCRFTHAHHIFLAPDRRTVAVCVPPHSKTLSTTIHLNRASECPIADQRIHSGRYLDVKETRS